MIQNALLRLAPTVVLQPRLGAVPRITAVHIELIAGNSGKLPIFWQLQVIRRDVFVREHCSIKSKGAVKNEVLSAAVETSLQRGAKSLIVKLDLAAEESIELAQDLRAKGMIFAGIEVHAERDYLCMQFVPDFKPGAYNHLALHCAESRRLLELVTQEFELR